jgi:riboflavin kinase/FMN adenylyltransferase
MNHQLKCISLETGRSIPIPDQTLLCLGNFDGVHYAHRKLILSAIEWQKQHCPEASVGVFCFDELPARYLDPNFQGKLCTAEARLTRFRECGASFVILADFTVLRDLTARDYIQSVLIESCNAVAVACGYNHRFGKGGLGNEELLKTYFGENMYLQDAVYLGGETVSSSRIRQLLQNGRPDEAAVLLTVPYEITAPVLHGKALGSRMGTPTVNQLLPEGGIALRRGVYVTESLVNGEWLRSVTNVGVRPTVNDGGGVNCETYLLNFSGDLYGRQMTVKFLKFIRDEQKFEDTDALWRQIRADVQLARDYH